jgi:hypothetical protein
MAKRRLGWLGPIIVLVGAIVAGLGTWYMVTARPKAGDVIDRIPITKGEIVIRAEQGGTRSFVELHENGALKWQAMIPTYAGAPGRRAVAWNDKAITVRVDRNRGRAEVFAFARATSSKLGALRLAQNHEPIRMHAEGPITLTDHVRAYELVGGADWHELIAVDLATGEGAWRAVLGKSPITAGGVEDGKVWLEQAGKRRWFDTATGREQPVTQSLN